MSPVTVLRNVPSISKEIVEPCCVFRKLSADKPTPGMAGEHCCATSGGAPHCDNEKIPVRIDVSRNWILGALPKVRNPGTSTGPGIRSILSIVPEVSAKVAKVPVLAPVVNWPPAATGGRKLSPDVDVRLNVPVIFKLPVMAAVRAVFGTLTPATKIVQARTTLEIILKGFIGLLRFPYDLDMQRYYTLTRRPLAPARPTMQETLQVSELAFDSVAFGMSKIGVLVLISQELARTGSRMQKRASNPT